MKTWIIITAAALTLAAPAMAGHKPANTGIVKFTGGVSHQNAAAFLKRLRDHSGKVIGLHIHIEAGDRKHYPDGSYLAAEAEDQFVLAHAEGGFGEAVEMTAPDEDVSWRNGEYELDGFYRVKNAGLNQGAATLTLEKLTPAALLLIAKSKVVETPVP